MQRTEHDSHAQQRAHKPKRRVEREPQHRYPTGGRVRESIEQQPETICGREAADAAAHGPGAHTASALARYGATDRSQGWQRRLTAA